MTKNKFLLLLVLALVGLVVVSIYLILSGTLHGTSKTLANPNYEPSPSPSPTTKQFKFDKSTNLQKELDSINPEIKDSDFN